MRLLVEGSLLSRSVQNQVRTYLGTSPMIPFRRLEFGRYPERMEDFEDVLWMGTSDEEEFRRRRQRMATRIRLASRDTEEIQQAAATQIVFDECAEAMSHARDQAIRRRLAKKVAGSGTGKKATPRKSTTRQR
jgi:hypothetical protein